LIDVNPGASLLFAQSQHLHALNIAGGSVMLAAAGTRILYLDTLTMDVTARLDLSDNAMIVTSGDTGSWDGSAYSGITGQVASGRDDGSWNGSGIVSSRAAGGNLTSIGVARASEVLGIGSADSGVWRGQTVAAADTLVMYTYGGDANLDGKIDISDYGRIDFNVALGVGGWFNGDFNYDGKIDISDYGVIDFNVGTQGVPLMG
jgi:hypothetical protein